MRNVALYGRSGSGKSTVAGIFVRHGYQHVNSGAPCRRISQELFGTESKEVLNRLSDAMMAIRPTVWLDAALRQADGLRPIVFDSMRYPHDYDELKSRGFFLIKLSTSQEARLSRLEDRGQEYNVLTDDQHVTERGLSDLPFDISISNDGGLRDLEAAVAGILTSFGLVPEQQP